MPHKLRIHLAKATLRILEEGFYTYRGQRISIQELQAKSEASTVGIPAAQASLLREQPYPAPYTTQHTLANESATVAIQRLRHHQPLGVLNFASATVPGGGFQTGAVAQEEDLAISSGLYPTQLRYPDYYQINRDTPSMMYTDTAIFSPDVVYFRGENLQLLPAPVTASTLTLPAVNFGQVIQQGEDQEKAKQVMKERMELALGIFAHFQVTTLILGAYGAGVFRNDPANIAAWWQELLLGKYNGVFQQVHFSVFDHSPQRKTFRLFEQMVTQLNNSL